MEVELLVLNYNGRTLLEACLPSIVEAAARSRHACRVSIVDNGSTDDSLAWLAEHYPGVRIFACENEGLCSFNRVLAQSSAQVAILLNNDIRLAADAVDPLVAPLAAQLGEGTQPPSDQAPCFFTAPLCWQWDGRTLEGFQTAVRWRFGLVQATGRFDGAETICHVGGETAAAGAVIAVDRQLFLSLGGFDHRYLPGRIEDLDFAFRGHMAGYRAVYVPEAVAWHRGAASFGPEFGDAGCLRLAYRNTLLFQWRHLQHPWHRLRQAVGTPLRLAADVCRAPLVPGERRFLFTKAWWEARQLYREERKQQTASATCDEPHDQTPHVNRRERLARERAYFRRFRPTAMLQRAGGDAATAEHQRDRRHPISRWYLLPTLDRVAEALASTSVRPWHITLAGLACVLAAITVLVTGLTSSGVAAGLVWMAWVCDRLDGKLARRQRTASRTGAWLDANVDEFCDLSIHAAMAWAASAAALASLSGATAIAAADLTTLLAPWLLVTAFVIGKYLLFYGMAEGTPSGEPTTEPRQAARSSWLKTLYHLPGNADVRWHLVIVALACSWFMPALAYVAAYFNVRWLVRAAKVLLQSRPQPALQEEPCAAATSGVPRIIIHRRITVEAAAAAPTAGGVR